MANFKTHISFGALIGISIIIIGLIVAIFSLTESLLWIFLAVLVGSFLPDLDMDDGVPFQIIFGLLGGGMAGLVFLNLYQEGERDAVILVVSSVMTFLVIRFGVGYVFKKFTDHRGIFHSIPCAILFGMLTLWLLNRMVILADQKMFMGLAVSMGYMGHLVLDEIYSSVNLHNHSLFPKQSLGSALKLKSSSKIATFFIYILIIIFTLTLPELHDLVLYFD